MSPARVVVLAILVTQLSGCVSASPFAAAPSPRPLSLTVVWLTPSQLLAEATAAMGEADYRRTVALANEALAMRIAPLDRMAAIELLCIGYPLVGDAKRGVESCELLFAERPDDWRVLNNLGNAHLHANRLLLAIEFYRRAAAALQEGGAGPSSGRHVESGEMVIGVDLVERNLESALRRLRNSIRPEDESIGPEGEPGVVWLPDRSSLPLAAASS